MKDYETAYYELYYKYRKLLEENKKLEEEIELLKKYKEDNVKDIIIKEMCRRKYERKKKFSINSNNINGSSNS